jgi:hypothetical protein
VKITTNIRTSDPNYPYTEEQAAAQVLAALGGDPTDTSTANVIHVTTEFATSVQLEEGDRMQYTADEAATQVLAALAGNPTTDHCTVSITMPFQQGEAGVPPA